MKTCKHPFTIWEEKMGHSWPTEHDGKPFWAWTKADKSKNSLSSLHKDAPLLVGCQPGPSFPGDSIWGGVRRSPRVNVEVVFEQVLQGPRDTTNPLPSLTDASAKLECSDEVNVIILQSCRMTAEFSSFDQGNNFLLAMLRGWGRNKALW